MWGLVIPVSLFSVRVAALVRSYRLHVQKSRTILCLITRTGWRLTFWGQPYPLDFMKLNQFRLAHQQDCFMAHFQRPNLALIPEVDTSDKFCVCKKQCPLLLVCVASLLSDQYRGFCALSLQCSRRNPGKILLSKRHPVLSIPFRHPVLSIPLLLSHLFV